jgi:catechol-2,3-dioxygenase
MLGDANVAATIAVKDINTGKQFYGETLGLKATDDSMQGVMYQSGDSMLFVYQSQFAGTNQATAATWKVDDVAACVEALTAAGVAFEHYDLPGATMEGDIHVMGNLQAVWFKDPDGNILNVTNGDMS